MTIYFLEEFTNIHSSILPKFGFILLKRLKYFHSKSITVDILNVMCNVCRVGLMWLSLVQLWCFPKLIVPTSTSTVDAYSWAMHLSRCTSVSVQPASMSIEANQSSFGLVVCFIDAPWPCFSMPCVVKENDWILPSNIKGCL